MTKSRLTKEEIAKRAEEYDNSRPIDVWKVSKYPEVTSAIDHICSEMKAKGKIKPQYTDKYRKHVKAISLDLYVANQFDPTRYVGYSRNSNKYKSTSRYKALFFNYRITINVIDFLIKHGYAEGPKGINRPVKPRQSRLRATERLIHLVKTQCKVDLPMIKRDENAEVIILRDEDKKLMEYEDTEATLQMRENLRFINQNLEKDPILLYVRDKELDRLNAELKRDTQKGAVDFTQKRLRRVFNNGSFKQGGRFYSGWWQNVPKEYRKYIRINDKDVVECDYSGLHINMLYAKEGLPLPEEDPYEIDGYGDIRGFLKQVLLRLVNANSRTSVIRSIMDRRSPAEAIDIPDYIGSLDDVIDDFMQKHSLIRKYFGTGIGVDLQYLDSQIAEKVLMHFSKMGYAILPMHDSFIIHHALKNELQKAMDNAFHEMFGVKCKVDLKYNSIEERQREGNGEPEICNPPIRSSLNRCQNMVNMVPIIVY